MKDEIKQTEHNLLTLIIKKYIDSLCLCHPYINNPF